MGVVNVTPDSFSDGGEAFDTPTAIARGLALVADGADIIDVGGESTRPGAEPLPIVEEISRILPIVRELAAAGVLVSIDTRHADVMWAAIDAGAVIVNDVTGLTGDDRSLEVVSQSGASVVLMHMQGSPRTMQRSPHYGNVLRDVRDWLSERISVCQAAGIDKSRIAVDPGIGFGKTVEHNVEILARFAFYRHLGCALVVGVSRKSFIARLSREKPPQERLGGSLAAMLSAVQRGAHIVRVHDVAATRQALDVWSAIGDQSGQE
jgi:dihydropteroate synthase